MDSGKGNKITDVAASLVFMILLWLPLAAMVLPIAPDLVLNEKRRLADLPVLQPTIQGALEYPRDFERFFKDRFGFRPWMVYAFNLARSRVPGLEIAGQVMVGKDGWYYISTNRTLDDYRGAIRLSPGELHRIRETLEARRRWMEGQGIRYLIVIAPAKWEIYPEHVPGYLGQHSEDSTVSQLLRYLKEASPELAVLDLRPLLRDVKEVLPVYDGMDTHWNQLGAFAAVHQMHERLLEWFPGLPLEPLDSLEMGAGLCEGDLAVLMGLDSIKKRKIGLLLRKDPRTACARFSDPEIPLRNMRFQNSDAGPRPRKAVMVHDSFGRVLYPFLPYCFGETLFVQSDYLDFHLIAKEKPDVVIQEIGQRSLIPRVLSNPRGVPPLPSSAAQ